MTQPQLEPGGKTDMCVCDSFAFNTVSQTFFMTERQYGHATFRSTNSSTPNRDRTQYCGSRHSLTSMDADSTQEAMREAQDIINRLYSVAHSVFCDEPDCPAAYVLNDPLGPNDVGTSPHEEALILVLLCIVENLGECLDLIRTLVASRNHSSELSPLTQPITRWDESSSGTSSHSHGEGTNANVYGPLREPPIPRLYHDQWTRSPAVSPPPYTSFCQSWMRNFPRAPPPSPATRGSETTTPEERTPITEDQYRESRAGQDDQQRVGIWTVPFIPASRSPKLPAGTPCRRRSPAGRSDSDHPPRGRFVAWVESDSEGGE